MTTLQQRIDSVYDRIRKAAEAAGRDPKEITLVAATKVQSSETIRQAIAAGVTVCGENRVQELTAHWEEGAYEGAQLHFIGRLQTNKVKYVVGKAHLIHSVDSLRLLEAIDCQAAKVGVVQPILLEVNVAGEESKGGFAPDEVLAAARRAAECPNICLRGLMTIPPIAVTPGENRPFFEKMARLYVDIRTEIKDNKSDIDCLSMGMSGDFEDAIGAGATMVRVGTALFGPRPPREDSAQKPETDQQQGVH